MQRLMNYVFKKREILKNYKLFLPFIVCGGSET